MSKSTKIIAALGVVAGLGVAALPAFTYAAYTPQSVSGTADVVVEVPEAIAITITGNNDDADDYGEAFDFVAVVSPTGNPHTSGYYERTGGSGTEQDPYTYALSNDTSVDGSKTYYEGNGGYRPVDNFTPSDGSVARVDGHPFPAILAPGTSSSYVEMMPNAVDLSTLTSTITIFTNSAKGYTLTAVSSDGGSLINQDDSSYTIDSITTAGTTPTAGAGEWAIKVNGGTTADDGDIDNDYEAWNVLPTSATQIAHEDIATSGGTQYVATYGVGTKTDQAAGIYKNTLTYTATTKNS